MRYRDICYTVLATMLLGSQLHATITQAGVYWSPSDNRFVFMFGDTHQRSTPHDEIQLNDLLTSFDQIPSHESYHVLIEQPSNLARTSWTYPSVFGSLKPCLEDHSLSNVTVEDIEVRCNLGAARIVLHNESDLKMLQFLSLDSRDKRVPFDTVSMDDVLGEVRELRAAVDPVKEWTSGEIQLGVIEDLHEIDMQLDDRFGIDSDVRLLDYANEASESEKHSLHLALSLCGNKLFNLNLFKRVRESAAQNVVTVTGASHASSLPLYMDLVSLQHNTWELSQQGPQLSLGRPWTNPLCWLYYYLKRKTLVCFSEKLVS